MTPLEALLAFSLAAGLLTLTPGLDTALVLRTAAVDGARAAMAAGVGIAAGCLAWGLLAALGLGAVLAVSEIAYAVLRFAGAAYLIYLGATMLRAALRRPAGTAVTGEAAGGRETAEPAAVAPTAVPHPTGPAADGGARRWFARGVMTNLLNPKVGVFYVSFLPQFVPAGVDVVGFSVLLAAIHAAMGIAWFAALTLATRPLAAMLRRPAVTRGLDAATGTALIGFGVTLALDRRLG